MDLPVELWEVTPLKHAIDPVMFGDGKEEWNQTYMCALVIVGSMLLQ
jgi:hypothetical protein